LQDNDLTFTSYSFDERHYSTSDSSILITLLAGVVPTILISLIIVAFVLYKYYQLKKKTQTVAVEME